MEGLVRKLLLKDWFDRIWSALSLVHHFPAERLVGVPSRSSCRWEVVHHSAVLPGAPCMAPCLHYKSIPFPNANVAKNKCVATGGYPLKALKSDPVIVHFNSIQFHLYLVYLMSQCVQSSSIASDAKRNKNCIAASAPWSNVELAL